MTTPTDGEKNPFEDLVLELVDDLFDAFDAAEDTDTDTEDPEKEEIDRE